MSAFTPASEVLLRHSDDFESARVLFAGDLQDDLPARLDTAASRAHTQQFHHWQVLSRQMGENARYSLVAEAGDVADCSFPWDTKRKAYAVGDKKAAGEKSEVLA